MKTIIALFVLATLVLTGCKAAEDTTEAIDTPSDIASLSAQEAWDVTPEESRDSMCLGLYAYGREWAVHEIRRGGDSLTEQDALVAVALIQRECDAR